MLSENYLKDKRPEEILISEYRYDQTIIVRGQKTVYDPIDFWLASLTWFGDGEECSFEPEFFEPITGPNSVQLLQDRKFLFNQRVLSDKIIGRNIEQTLENVITDGPVICFYEMDDTWNDYLALIETEAAYYFYRWWTAE